MPQRGGAARLALKLRKSPNTALIDWDSTQPCPMSADLLNSRAQVTALDLNNSLSGHKDPDVFRFDLEGSGTPVSNITVRDMHVECAPPPLFLFIFRARSSSPSSATREPNKK